MTKLIVYILYCILFVKVGAAQLNCDADSTGLISLVDLQEDNYLGFQGGLYPEGSNFMPAEHKTDGLNIARTIKPLDSLGNVDWENGKIVFLGMGASVAGNPWNNVINLTKFDTDLNPCMQLINACVGSKGLNIMVDLEENSEYWYEDVIPRIENKYATPYQVQAIWIKHAYKHLGEILWPDFPDSIVDFYEQLIPILMDTFPNLKLMFLSGFTYGGYADSTYNFYNVVVEPGSYWTNWAPKWLIEKQIKNEPHLEYKGAGREAPWMAWGPHVWADGERANEWDGLQWFCETDYNPDGGGYHLSYGGVTKEANMIIDWAKSNPVTKKWFLDGPKWNSCDPSGRLANGEAPDNAPTVTKEGIVLYPSPNNGIFNLKLSHGFDGFADIQIVNSFGQVVYVNQLDCRDAMGNVSVNLGDVPNGVYIMHLNLDGVISTKEFLVSR